MYSRTVRIYLLEQSRTIYAEGNENLNYETSKTKRIMIQQKEHREISPSLVSLPLLYWLDIFAVMNSSNQVVDLRSVNPMVFLPSFPRVMRINTSKRLEYLVRCSFRFVREVLGQQDIIVLAIP